MPTSNPSAGATAAVHSLAGTGHLDGQSQALFHTLLRLADRADRAVRQCGHD